MTTTLFATLHFDDARAGTAFLRSLGFTETAAYWADGDPHLLDHGEYSWRGGGAVMCGSASRESVGDYRRTTGVGSMYLVVASDEDVDRLHAAALAAGGSSAQEPMDPPYGGRTCTVRDLEGNQFSIGSYGGSAG